jgi:hypothetical protein
VHRAEKYSNGTEDTHLHQSYMVHPVPLPAEEIDVYHSCACFSLPLLTAPLAGAVQAVSLLDWGHPSGYILLTSAPGQAKILQVRPLLLILRYKHEEVGFDYPGV